ncbi:glutaredoxin-C9-like [Zingiber officinale]|uniref:Glutaredoxin domain-containing protein n=1 Tax=Zingiber officinale TaxID=94328 RepID=A0A8J5LB45_ZINOF|nr:glutaredoxin-C9-like [Zingiber officinale]KAG6507337.1 hypothetical protein ZIOFF_032679 [Zingiber officinale]
MRMVEVKNAATASSPFERVARMASGNAVVVFSVSSCCMCHVVKRLLLGLGVGPTVYELDQLDKAGSCEIQAVLEHLLAAGVATGGAGCSSTSTAPSATAVAVPAVFVGGKLLGGVEKVMSCHINGSLVPLLKQAGALWL